MLKKSKPTLFFLVVGYSHFKETGVGDDSDWGFVQVKLGGCEMSGRVNSEKGKKKEGK